MTNGSQMIEFPDGVARLSRDHQARLLTIFLSALPELLDSLLSAIKEADEQLIAHYSHKLKGMSQIVGAGQLTTIAIDLQHRCASVERDQVQLLTSVAEATVVEADAIRQAL